MSAPGETKPVSPRVKATAIALWVLTLVGAVAMVPGSLPGVVPGDRQPGLTDTLLFLLLGLDALACATVGALIAVRRPDNRIGWLLSLLGVAIVAAFAGFSIGSVRATTLGRDDVVAGLFGWMGVMSIHLVTGLIGAIALLFPNGRLPSRRWRYVAVPPFIAIGLSMIATAVQPEWDLGLAKNPFAIDHPITVALTGVFQFGTLGSLLALLVGAAALVWRFVRSGGDTRQQMKWFAASVTLSVTSQLVEQFVPLGNWSSLVSSATVVLLPVSIGVAVLRYRLYDIDRIISRTLGWTVVTVILGVVFAGLLIALQTLLAGVTQSRTIAVAASTLVAFVLFQPVRRLVQAAVDRRFDRAHYDAVAVVERFSSRLRHEHDLVAVRREVERVADTTVRPSSVGLWLRTGRGR
jgi:hypothetical protein